MIYRNINVLLSFTSYYIIIKLIIFLILIHLMVENT